MCSEYSSEYSSVNKCVNSYVECYVVSYVNIRKKVRKKVRKQNQNFMLPSISPSTALKKGGAEILPRKLGNWSSGSAD